VADGCYLTFTVIIQVLKYVKVWNADNKFNEKMGTSVTQNIFYTETSVTFSWIRFCRQVV